MPPSFEERDERTRLAPTRSTVVGRKNPSALSLEKPASTISSIEVYGLSSATHFTG
jgi:hypothetical protein